MYYNIKLTSTVIRIILSRFGNTAKAKIKKAQCVFFGIHSWATMALPLISQTCLGRISISHFLFIFTTTLLWKTSFSPILQRHSKFRISKTGHVCMYIRIYLIYINGNNKHTVGFGSSVRDDYRCMPYIYFIVMWLLSFKGLSFYHKVSCCIPGSILLWHHTRVCLLTGKNLRVHQWTDLDSHFLPACQTCGGQIGPKNWWVPGIYLVCGLHFTYVRHIRSIFFQMSCNLKENLTFQPHLHPPVLGDVVWKRLAVVVATLCVSEVQLIADAGCFCAHWTNIVGDLGAGKMDEE